MSDGRKLILSPFTGRKNRKAWNKTKERYMLEERRENLAKTDKSNGQKQSQTIKVHFFKKEVP